MLYFAYGSNLNVKQMKRRCPKAKPLCKIDFPGWQLVFKGVLDIIPHSRAKVIGGLWRITTECELALDAYEGYPNLYTKELFKCTLNGKKEVGLLYRMCHGHAIAPPGEYYYNICHQGFKDFEIDTRRLRRAREHAFKNFGRYGKTFHRLADLSLVSSQN
jgi:hypothetical protein